MWIVYSSGSAFGQTLRVIKLLTLSITSMLTPNDYINAVWFNKKVGNVLNLNNTEGRMEFACSMQGFVPATARNKIVS
jgi:hypothetical protein